MYYYLREVTGVREYFPGLIGNIETKARLGRAIEAGTLPHAFLIGGPSGSGKSTLALQIAAAMNCLSKNVGSSPLPCGNCSNCRRISEGNYPDVKLLAKKKDKATLGVEAVKDFREDMFLSSTESEHKIYIIDDAECMTPEAQNALLKVLEEPPTAVSIILLARECDRILTTIKSRSQYIAMSRFEDSELSRHLLSVSAEARAMNIADSSKFSELIISADGRLGLALELMNRKSSEEITEERNEIIELIRAIGKNGSYADVYTAISRFPTKRAELCVTLERLINALRDLTVIRYDQNAKTLFFPSQSEAKELCGNIPAKRLINVYDAVNEAHGLIGRNANVANIMSSLCAKIRLA